MTIALIAHDSKKELMVQFCMAYRHILEQHRLLATGTTGRLIEENTGLKVTKFLPGGHGGAEQIVARIACEEVDMLLFFRDPISAKPSEPNEMNLLRICDVHNVPVAHQHCHRRGPDSRPGARRFGLARNHQSAAVNYTF